MNNYVNPLPKLVAVVGPTASGKTDIALAIAHAVAGSDPATFCEAEIIVSTKPKTTVSDTVGLKGAEIIVADSRQIYRGVNVASNKANGEWRMENGERMFYVEGTPYHGLDLVEPDDILTVSQWKQTTLQTIDGIISRGHLPIIEGGTGLYIAALLDNYDFPEVPPDPALRAQIEKQIDDMGLESVTDELLLRDPNITEFLDIENRRRVVRALEVIEITGKPFSEQRTKKPKLFDDLRIGMKWTIEALDERIEARAQAQFDSGLEEEAKKMLERYTSTNSAHATILPSMTSIGYLEWRDYFDGKISREEVLVQNIKRNKKLARAQMKWFKRDESIKWVKSPDEAVTEVKKFLNT